MPVNLTPRVRPRVLRAHVEEAAWWTVYAESCGRAAAVMSVKALPADVPPWPWYLCRRPRGRG